MNTEPAPFLLEKHMIPHDSWDLSDVPPKALVVAEQAHSMGIPTGIAFYEDQWYVLVTQGQGPDII